MRDRWQLVGREIRAARIARAWSQELLAELTGLRQAHVSRDERGPAKGIDSTRLAAYIRVLQLDQDQIMAIVYGPADEDLQLQVKLRAAAAIPGLDEEDRQAVEDLLRERHRPSPPLRPRADVVGSPPPPPPPPRPSAPADPDPDPDDRDDLGAP